MNEMKLIGEYVSLYEAGPTSRSDFEARKARMTEIATTLVQSDDPDVQVVGVLLLLRRSFDGDVRSKVEQLLKRKPQA